LAREGTTTWDVTVLYVCFPKALQTLLAQQSPKRLLFRDKGMQTGAVLHQPATRDAGRVA
jgi:hypothetical protein